jgi:hypothetical protein
MTLEHTEAHLSAIVDAVSRLTLDDVLLIETALRAGWLTNDERIRLAPLADAFQRLWESS